MPTVLINIDNLEIQSLAVFVEIQERCICNAYGHVDHPSSELIWDFLSETVDSEGKCLVAGVLTADEMRGKILHKINKKLHLVRHCSALASLF